MTDQKRIETDYYVEPRKYGRTGFSYLTFQQRQTLEVMLKAKRPIKDIATAIGITRGTIYYERMRMGSTKIPYDAKIAHEDAQESRKCDRLRHGKIPKKYANYVSQLYRHVETLMASKMSCEHQVILEDCHRILESMGANPDKIKRPLSIQEETQIIELWKKGLTYSDIERKTGRSRSTVSSTISAHQEKLNQPTQELEYEQLSNKWVTE